MTMEPIPGIPDDKMTQKIEDMTDAARKIGLYTNHVAFFADEESPEGMQQHKLLMQFSVGDVAFSTRVQDPEQEQFNDDFGRIESRNVFDEMENIRDRYRKEGDVSSQGTGTDTGEAPETDDA